MVEGLRGLNALAVLHAEPDDAPDRRRLLVGAMRLGLFADIVAYGPNAKPAARAAVEAYAEPLPDVPASAVPELLVLLTAWCHAHHDLPSDVADGAHKLLAMLATLVTNQSIRSDLLQRIDAAFGL